MKSGTKNAIIIYTAKTQLAPVPCLEGSCVSLQVSYLLLPSPDLTNLTKTPSLHRCTPR